ncbi:hypothetical protein BC629DRAFT_770323 [Irpex lacteus]|nr:hypothetical protein BC629DRAFT_770323 [Irpex lacteus]
MQCVVRGSINIDEFFHLPSIVRPGQTLSSTNLTRRAGGKGANQAVAVARALSLSPPSSSSPPAASNAPSASASVVPPSSTTTPSPSTSDALDKDKTPLARVSLAGAIGPDGTWILPVLCSAGVDAGLVSVLGAGAGDKVSVSSLFYVLFCFPCALPSLFLSLISSFSRPSSCLPYKHPTPGENSQRTHSPRNSTPTFDRVLDSKCPTSTQMS